MSHACHAFQCRAVIPPQLFMCAFHWRKVPAALKSRIWANYVKGQCSNWALVTRKYADAAQEAIRQLAQQEGYVMTGKEPELTLYDMCCGTTKQPGLFK